MTDEKFLLGESREGFYVPSQIKQAWAAQLQILKEIDRVCAENGLKYYAGWGTLLGAVRHGGYIPWDDDMDIVMRRDDYAKLLEIAPKAFPEGYHIQTYENQDDFWLFMGKVVAKNYMCFEPEHLREFNGFPYIACVDIFVLDNVYMDPEKEEERRKNLTFALGVADGIVEGTYKGSKAEELIRDLEKRLRKRLERSNDPVTQGRIIYKEIERNFAAVPDEEADTLSQLFPWGLKNDRKHMPINIFEDTIRVPFEDMMISVPLAFDYFARKCYGNYWVVRKDGGAHRYPFFEGQKDNLRKVLDFDLPEYTPDGSELLREANEHPDCSGSFKALAIECLGELEKITYENAYEAQQLAIDLGTMLESLRGEGLPSVKLLEGYCEELYRYSQGESTVDALDDILGELRQAVETEIKKKDVVFLPVLADEWEFFESTYEKCLQQKDIVVHVVPIPYYYKEFDKSARKICYDGELFPEEIRIEDYRKISLELLQPETIFVQNAYDDENPIFSISRDFYSACLRSVTERVVYIPPIECDDFDDTGCREYHNMNYYVNIPGVLRADEIVLNSSDLKKMYIEKLVDFAGEKYRPLFEKKIVVPSQKPADGCKTERKKKILFVSSMGRLFEEGTDAVGKVRAVLELFRKNAESVDVKWYIYPTVTKAGFDENISKLPPERRKEFESLLSEYFDYAVEFRSEWKDYYELVDECDAYYGDVCPLMRLCQCGHKPIMLMNYEII